MTSWLLFKTLKLSTLKTNIMDKVKAFFETPTSNMVGVCLGGALIGINMVEFSVIGIVAGFFLLVAEGLQYFERSKY
jgi:hypothetical protein